MQSIYLEMTEPNVGQNVFARSRCRVMIFRQSAKGKLFKGSLSLIFYIFVLSPS